MKLAIIVALGVASVGCASQEQLNQRAMNTAPQELCYLSVAGGDQSVRSAAYYGINSRGINCEQYAGMVNARIQANAANQAAAMRMLQAAQPRPAVQPTLQANCKTYYHQGYARTICD